MENHKHAAGFFLFSIALARSQSTGNPRYGSCWNDEGFNRVVARWCAASHRAKFELRVLSTARSLKRQFGE